jgi:hypothetical protein
MNAIDLQYHRKFQDALGSGDMFALYERTREAIAKFPDDPEVRYLQALAMARLGDPHAAMRLYERNRVDEISSEDAIALKGRLLKDLAVRTSGRSRSTCFANRVKPIARHFELSDGYFSGINAATTSFLAGDEDDARLLAAAIAPPPGRLRPARLLCSSIRAEAKLVCGEVEQATALFAEARRRPDASPGMVASTARQVALIAGRLSVGENQRRALLGSIRPTPVIHYCGHMFAAGWQPRKARLPKRYVRSSMRLMCWSATASSPAARHIDCRGVAGSRGRTPCRAAVCRRRLHQVFSRRGRSGMDFHAMKRRVTRQAR